MAAADEDETPPASPPSAAKKSTMSSTDGASKATGSGSSSNSTSRGRKRSRRDDDEEDSNQVAPSDGNGGNKFSATDGKRKRKARKTAHDDGSEAKASAAAAAAAPAPAAAAARAKASSPARRKNAAPAPPAKAAPAQAKQLKPPPRAGSKASRTPERTSNGISGAAAFRAKAAAASESPRATPKKKRAAKTSVSIDPSPSVISTSNASNGIASPFTAATKSVSDILDNPASVRKWLRILLFVTLIEAVVLCGNVFIGAHMEHKAIENATSTQALYTEDHRVCGRVKTDANGDKDPSFMTFASAKRARMYNDDAEEESGGSDDGGVDIVHCGQCGKCSTTRDMTILAQTTQTLTDTARGCSVRAFLGSVFLLRGIGTYRSISQQCMEAKVGFTPPCLDCWLDNMVCGVQKCVFTCLKSQYIDWDPKNHADGKINRCFECDEKLCGPAFLECSGTNRRRQGIRSDLSRDDDKELCRSVDVDWNNYAGGGEGRKNIEPI